MSDHFFVLTFPRLAEKDAAEIADTAKAHLLERNMIAGVDAPDAVLSRGARHTCRPAASFAEQHGIAELRTNGVAFHVPRYFNSWALGDPELICPACGVAHRDDGEMIDRIGNALMAFSTGSEPEEVACPTCAALSPAHYWKAEGNALAGTLGIEFWNWPSPQELGLPTELAAVANQSRVDFGFVRI